MGNQILSKINPCSDKFISDPKSNIYQFKTQINEIPRLKRIKSMKLSDSVAKKLRPQLPQPNIHQNQQSFSTDASSSINEQLKFSPSFKKTNHQNQISPIKQKPQNRLQAKIKKIFIFDWDDTLFFSSYLREQNCSIKQFKVDKDVLQKFDNKVHTILEQSLKIGEVYIVTNSKQGWVKQSSSKFLPKTYNLIFINGRIKVISTRPVNGDIQMYNYSRKWKYTAFKDIMNEITPLIYQQIQEELQLHIICIGDSQQQINATNEIYEEYEQNYKNLYIKTIKLQDFPNIQDLLQELQLFNQNLNMIVNQNKKLAIKLQRPKNKIVQPSV